VELQPSVKSSKGAASIHSKKTAALKKNRWKNIMGRFLCKRQRLHPQFVVFMSRRAAIGQQSPSFRTWRR
jgi:hypothetical protein